MVTANPTTTDLAVSLPEAAKRIGISRAGIWNLALAGTLPTVKIGARRLVRISVLEEFLRERETGQDDDAATGSLPAAARGRTASESSTRPPTRV